MSVFYNRTGPERKALVQAISEILGCEYIYQGAPSFAYVVGDYVIDRNGTLTRHTGWDAEQTGQLIAALAERGYEESSPEPETDFVEETLQLISAVRARGGDEKEHPELAVTAEPGPDLTIDTPKYGFTDEALENLRKIIESKKTLIEKALGIDDLPFGNGLRVNAGEDTLSFPWFPLHGLDGEADAYARFVHALCDMAKRQKRVTAKERETENDKLAMRLFLIRLGFIGPEYKAARKILLRNLTGNSSWKHGKPETDSDAGTSDDPVEVEPYEE